LRKVDADVTAHLGLAKSAVAVGASTTGVKRYTTYHYPVEVYDGAAGFAELIEQVLSTVSAHRANL